MQYTKPIIVAQTAKKGSFAAGCPEKDRGCSSTQDNPRSGDKARCANCERTV